MISVSILVLAACSNTPTPIDKETKVSESTLSAEEVYKKAMIQLNSLDNAAFNLSIEQTKNVSDDEKATTKANVTGELIKEPLMSHLNGSITIESEPIGTMVINIEMYAQDETIYVYEDLFNNWIKGTTDDLADIGLEISKDQSPLSHVEGLDQYIEDFAFEQTNDTYNFTLKTNNDELNQLIIDEIQDFQLTLNKNEDYMGAIDINHLQYSFTIDKETFNLLAFNINSLIDITENNGTTAVESTVKADFSNFNDIREIMIPQDVIKEAVDRNDAFGF